MKQPIHVLKNIAFHDNNHTPVTADVYFPNQTTSSCPALLLIHGGAWRGCTKAMYESWGPFLAEAGYVAMAIDYRLATKDTSTWPGVLEDVQKAFQYLTEHAKEWNVDMNRIGIIGDSAGSHLGNLLALNSSRNGNVKAIVGIYGVYDLFNWWEYKRDTGDNNPVEWLMGARPDEAEDAYKLASPMYRIGTEKHDMEFLIIWGEDDPIVPAIQSERYVQKLRETNNTVETLSFPGKGHFWFNMPLNEGGVSMNEYPNNEVAPKILDFLSKNLKNS